MTEYVPSDTEKASLALAPELQMTIGACPVQINGTLPDGNYFYFRSRGEHWSVEIAASENELFEDKSVYYFEQDYGDEPYQAGYIPHGEAWGFVYAQLSRYYEQKQMGELTANHVFKTITLSSEELRDRVAGLAGNVLYRYNKTGKVASDDVKTVELLMAAIGMTGEDVDEAIKQRLADLRAQLGRQATPSTSAAAQSLPVHHQH